MKKVISDTEQDYLRSHVQKNEEASIITRILAIRKYVRPPSVEILDEFEKELDKTFRMIDLANKLERDKFLIELLMPLFEGVLRERGRWQECIVYGKLMLNVAKRSNNKVAEGWALVNPIGWTLIQLGNYKEGIIAIKSGIEAFQLSNHYWGIWAARRFMAQAYREIGKENNSLQDMNMAYEILTNLLTDVKKAYGFNLTHFRSLPRKYGGFIARRYVATKLGFNLPAIASSINEKTLKYEAIQYTLRHPHHALISLLLFLWVHIYEYISITLHLYGDLGYVECCRRNLRTAETYLRRNIITLYLLRREMELGIYMVDYGDVARTAKEWQKAEKRYKTAISIAEKYQRKITIVEASIGLSEVLQHLGKHTESLKLKNTAKKICEEIDIDYLFVEQRMRNI